MSIQYDLTNEVYHTSKSLSASGAKTIAMKSLADYKHAKRDWVPAFDLGTATHTFVLEPDQAKNVWMGPETRRGKDWTQAKAEADEAGALLLTESDFHLANNMAEAVWNNPHAAKLLSDEGMIAEASIFAKDKATGAEIRCRPDGWIQDRRIVLDLKTTTQADPEGFGRQCASFGYHIQEAFYRRCMREAGEHIDRFIFIAVGKAAPFNVGIYELTEDSIAEGEAAVSYALEQYVMASSSGKWTSGYEDPRVLQIPRWAFKFTNNFDC